MKRGIVLLAASAFAFALSTVFAKTASSGYGVPGVIVSFFRFFSGLILIAPYMLIRKKSFRPVKVSFVVTRGITNTAAVMLFFLSIENTTISNANILNMTYPAFVFLAAPFINHEKIKLNDVIFLAVTLLGGYLIVAPEFGTVNTGDIYGLLSGIVGGVAISSLRESRKYDGTDLIMFYLMLIGLVMNTAAAVPVFMVPPAGSVPHIAAATVLSLAGQYLLTEGYSRIEAGAGAVISTIRIPIAAALGVMIFSDPLSWKIISGGVLIMISMAGISGFFRPASAVK